MARVHAWQARRRNLGDGGLTLRLAPTAVTVGSGWLLLLPLGLWAIATLYLPIMAPFLAGAGVWLVALACLLLIVASLVAHVLGHAWAATLLAGPVPPRVALDLWGDAAQAWPPARTPRAEALIALAGPAVNLLLAGLAYLVWDRQVQPVLNAGLLLLVLVNLWLAIINLAPGFPLDGGRLVRASLWGLRLDPVRATRLSLRLGRLLAAALLGWGLLLLLQRARFSLEVAAATGLVAVLFALGSRRPVAWPSPPPVPAPPPRLLIVRRLVAALPILLLCAAPASLAPILHGLHAPGSAEAVESMIDLPPAYRHAPAGSFLLTTVISQTPILAGQWLYAQFDPAVAIVPPTAVVPVDTTPQELMARNYRLLDDSRLTAAVVALRLAGYAPQVSGEAVEVTSVLPESHARGVLQRGDRILAVDGVRTGLAAEVTAQIQAHPPATPVEVLIERSGERRQFRLPLLPPAVPGDPPRLGIGVQTVGLTAELPVPVQIEPHKLFGGPSAGLMFTLTIYNLLTPDDLTGGHRIAGTGTIALDGTVGPIGGVAQKVAAAEHAGAAVFLVPPANAAEARRVARRITVIEVASAEAAITALRALPPAGR